MTWGDIILTVVMYCSKVAAQDDCRNERVSCMRRAVEQHPKNNNAIEFMDKCLAAPDSFKPPVVIPAEKKAEAK